MTLGDIIKRIREEIGDEIRLNGVATGGGVDRIDDTSLLTQADNYWKWMTVRITGTTDGLAPKGEARKIAASTLGSITVETPFSAGVNSGDQYEIAFFGRDRLVSVVNDSLKEWARLIPYRKVDKVTTSVNSDKIVIPNSDEVLWIDKIEFREDAKQEVFNYEGFWVWDEHNKVVRWDFFWNEVRTLDIYTSRVYPKVFSDTDSLNIKAQHEHLFLRLCVANVIASISTQEWRNNRGELQPLEIRMGDFVQRFGDYRKAAREHKIMILEQIKAELGVTIAGSLPRKSFQPTKFDRKEDPDGWVPPAIFWTLK